MGINHIKKRSTFKILAVRFSNGLHFVDSSPKSTLLFFDTNGGSILVHSLLKAPSLFRFCFFWVAPRSRSLAALINWAIDCENKASTFFRCNWCCSCRRSCLALFSLCSFMAGPRRRSIHCVTCGRQTSILVVSSKESKALSGISPRLSELIFWSLPEEDVCCTVVLAIAYIENEEGANEGESSNSPKDALVWVGFEWYAQRLQRQKIPHALAPFVSAQGSHKPTPSLQWPSEIDKNGHERNRNFFTISFVRDVLPSSFVHIRELITNWISGLSERATESPKIKYGEVVPLLLLGCTGRSVRNMSLDDNPRFEIMQPTRKTCFSLKTF